MPTLTLYPATGRAVLSGVLHVGQRLTLAVAIDSAETATFSSGHAYRLTIKRRGYLAADPYVQETLTVTGDRTATVALDLRLAALYTAIASRDTLATQWSVDDLENGVLGWTASAAAIQIANTAARDGDVADPPAGVAITADDLAAAADSLQSQIDGRLALSLVTTAGDTLRGTGAGTVEKVAALTVLAEAGAGDWAPVLKANSTHTVVRSGIWTDITPSGLEPGEGCSGRITGQYAAGTTGLAAAFDGALDDIGAAVVDFVIYRIGSTYYGACREVV
jgi:hypothetical protein